MDWPEVSRPGLHRAGWLRSLTCSPHYPALPVVREAVKKQLLSTQHPVLGIRKPIINLL